MRDVLINHPLPHKNFEGVPVKFYRLGSSEGLINEEAMHKIKASND